MTVGETIRAEQFNAHGKVMRQVEISVLMPSTGKSAVLSVTPIGGGRMVQYDIAMADWVKLCAVIPVRRTLTRRERRCVCGYPARDLQDLDEHILGMASGGSEEGSHREAR